MNIAAPTLLTVNEGFGWTGPLTLSGVCAERAIARHEVREIEQRHTQDGLREREAPSAGAEDVVIIYNRVPKTASTSFTNIAYDLCAKNHFHVLHINTTKNNPVMSMQDQVSGAGWSESQR